ECYGRERVAAIGRCEQSILKGSKQFGFPTAWMYADIPAPTRALQTPGPAPINRLVEAVGCRCIDDRRCLRIHNEIIEAHADEWCGRQYSPSRASVGRPVNTGTEIEAEISFATSGVDPFFIAGIEGDGADSERWHFVGSRLPVGSRVLALPDAATSGTEQNMFGVTWIDSNARHSADHIDPIGAMGLSVRDVVGPDRLPHRRSRRRPGSRTDTSLGSG